MSDSVQLHRWQPNRLRPPWDSPGKNTGVGCHFLLQCMKVKSESEVANLSRVRLLATPWTAAYQAPQSTGFSRQGYWSGMPLPSPGDLPNPGIELGSPTLQADTLPPDPPGKILFIYKCTCEFVFCHKWWYTKYTYVPLKKFNRT